jgi:sugar phosphate isomerase/epimerase
MIPIAVQLYSVRDEAARDLLGTLGRVADMGYAGVEFAGYHGHDGETLRRRLDELGLKCEGTHTGIDQLAHDKIDATVELHKTLGTSFVLIPWMPEAMRNSPEAIRDTGLRLTELTQRLAKEGLQLGFHAHDADMRPLAGGVSAWDLLAANTPETFLLQYDTSNGVEGGADPVKPILDHPGRSQSVHLKETDGQVIGEGRVPWKDVFEACEGVGKTEWYVVEHESRSGEEALAAVDACFQALRAMGKV